MPEFDTLYHAILLSPHPGDSDTMQREIEWAETVPDAFEAMQQLESVIGDSELDDSLVEFVKLRASQLNGCAYCVDMHTKEAQNLGEDNRRIAAVAAWRESPFFTDRERTALRLTEELTRLASQPISETVYRTVNEQFTEKEFISLVLTIISINTWNRLWVSFHTPTIPDL